MSMSWAYSMAPETGRPSQCGSVISLREGNLTEAALDRNIEMGLVLRDRALAASVTRHFRGLIERGLLRALPQE